MKLKKTLKLRKLSPSLNLRWIDRVARRRKRKYKMIGGSKIRSVRFRMTKSCNRTNEQRKILHFSWAKRRKMLR